MKPITTQKIIPQTTLLIIANGRPIQRMRNKIIEPRIKNPPRTNLKKYILASFHILLQLIGGINQHLGMSITNRTGSGYSRGY